MNKEIFLPYGLKDVVSRFLPENEIEDFAVWAFGEDYADFIEIMDFSQAWNRNHSDLYKIDMDNTIVNDVYKMTNYFKNRNTDGQCRT